MKKLIAFILLALCSPACVAGSVDESGDELPPDPESVATAHDELRLSVVDRCSDSQERKLRGAERLAYYITAPTIIDWITKSRAGKPHWLVDKFFDDDGVWDQQTTDFVKKNMAKIHARIGEGDVTVRCRDILACNNDGMHAYVRKGRLDKITFCDAFFESSPADNAATWVHELSHELLDTDDPIREPILRNVHDLATRKASFSDTEMYVNGGGTKASTQYDGFVINLIGQFFDDWYRGVGKGPMTAAELDLAIQDVHAEIDPLKRIRGEVPKPAECQDGQVQRQSCPVNMIGESISECIDGKWVKTSFCRNQGPGNPNEP